MIDIRAVSRLVAPGGCALAFSLLTAAQSVKLNGPLPHQILADVGEYAFSPDGSRVVYRADQVTDGVQELFSVPSDGSATAVRLNDPLVPGREVRRFAVGAGRVVYSADLTTAGHFELFSVPLDGSATPLALANANVDNIWIAPNGTLALFSVFSGASGGLYRVPVDGSAAPAVLALTQEDYLIEVTFTNDGTRALYRVQHFDDELDPIFLFQVPVDGSSAPVRLDSAADNGGVAQFVVSADGSRVAVVEGIVNITQLFALAIDGSQRVQLNTPGRAVDQLSIVPDGSRVLFMEIEWSPGIGRLVSIASDGTQRVEVGPAGGGPLQAVLAPDATRVAFTVGGDLYGASIGGTVLLATGDIGSGLAISDDSSTVVFTQTSADFRGLYAVPITGGTPVLLNGPPLPFRGLASQNQILAIHGPRVVFRQDRGTANALELYSAPLDGSQPATRLSATMTGGRDVISFRVAVGGARVAYLADQEQDGVSELFGNLVAGGGPPLRYNSSFPLGPIAGDVTSFQHAEPGAVALYRADESSDEVFDLYAAPQSGGSSLSLSSTLADGDVREDYVSTPSGAEAVFVFVPTSFVPQVLYAVATDGASEPRLLDTPGTLPAPLVITPDEARVVYRRAASANNLHLRSARLDGSTPAVSLHGAVPSNRTVTAFALSPDGAFVFFVADHGATAGVFQLYRAPVDASAPAVLVGAVTNVGGDVTGFAPSPDGSRVVYLADALVDQDFELWSTSGAGGRPPVRLNAPLASDEDVTGFAITPDSGAVIFLADQRLNGTTELFRVPIDGKRPPHGIPGGTLRTGSMRRLTPLPTGRDVMTDFTGTSDGAQVVYRADALVAGRPELWRVAADGSSAPVRVNGTLPAGGSVLAFALSPLDDFVFYQANQSAVGVVELFRAPLAGGPAVVVDSMPAFADVQSFAVAPDGSCVVWSADRDVDEQFELYGVVLDGSLPTQTLSGPMAASGDVQAGFRALAGGRALYRADQDVDDVFELFLGSL